MFLKNLCWGKKRRSLGDQHSLGVQWTERSPKVKEELRWPRILAEQERWAVA